MRLSKYLNEKKEIYPNENISNDKEAWKAIEKDCKYYLKLLAGRKPLYRSMKYLGAFMYKKDVRQDRKPKGSPRYVFKVINYILKKHGHVPRDKAAIATTDDDTLHLFGKPHFFFPIGKFNYTWLKGRDFNLSTYPEWDFWRFEAIVEDEDNYDEAWEYAKDFYTTNKGFDTAYRRGYEIWFDCKEYYAIPDISPLYKEIENR